MSDQRLKLAVFIDFDNVEIGVKTTLNLQFDVGAVLEAIKERGEIITKVAYGDWKRAGDHGRAMSQHAVRLVQRVMTPGGDKNGADINLALDALEMAFTHDHINAFVIVGGDSDFITLVEKLKQYDKKVFVVGGRAFTSQVMQKNCTEFIAYENVASQGSPVPSYGRQGFGGRPERGRFGGASLDQALPLVKRALKVLADREVSPQLGLLKSTLLQLDSSFSERDYGASTFREFSEKLEQRGFVTLKHSGRTTVVELAEGAAKDADAAIVDAAASSDRTTDAVADTLSNGSSEGSSAPPPSVAGWSVPEPELSLADGVALVRAVLAEATTPPRWPMYLRQMKQFIRAARPDFDERRYGSLPDLLRACQKDGLLRLERDRQGGLRAFGGSYKPSSVPHGWGTVATADAAPPDPEATVEVNAEPSEGLDPPSSADPERRDPAPPEPVAVFAVETASDDDPEGDDQLAMFGVVLPTDPDPVPKARTRRSSKGGGSGASDKAPRRRARSGPRPPGEGRGAARGDGSGRPRGRARGPRS
jgi:uncharacterized LabA/DUF88 family protein